MRMFFRSFQAVPCLCLAISICAPPTVAAETVSCGDWNTEKFFERVDAADVSRCLKAKNPNARDKYGQTPLHRAAARSKMPAVVTTLVKAGAKINARNTDGWTPLHFAARENGTLTVMKTLLRVGAKPNARDQKGNTPLYLAVVNKKSSETLTTLLKSGADPNIRNQHGQAPLHYAAGIARAEAINLAHTIAMILGMKAELAALEKSESLKTAKRKAKLAEEAYIKNAEATKGDNLTAVIVLLGAGANPNLQDKSGKTPLHYAAAHSKKSTVAEVLLKSGANPAARDKSGKTPWDYAKENPALKGTEVYWQLNEARFK